MLEPATASYANQYAVISLEVEKDGFEGAAAESLLFHSARNSTVVGTVLTGEKSFLQGETDSYIS